MSFDWRTRLRRLEEAMQAVDPPESGIALMLQTAREGHNAREARGEPHPPPRVLYHGHSLSWQSREMRERMNRAGVRMFRAGDAGYEAFAELAAQIDAKQVLGAIAGGASPFPTSRAPPCPTP